VFKKQQRDSFSSWYAQDLKIKLDNGLNVEDVKMCLRLSVVKPLHAEWVITTMSTLKKKEEVGQQGFRLAGTLDCFEAILADMQPLNQGDEQHVLIATQEELETAEQMGYETNEYDSSDDELTIAELMNQKKIKMKVCVMPKCVTILCLFY
jgi:hypothetical protein